VRSEVGHDQLTKAGVVILKVVHEPSRRHAPVSPHDLEAELQMTLAILSDIDRAYEQLRNRVHSWSGPTKRKEHLSSQLEKPTDEIVKSGARDWLISIIGSRTS
jgi:hypothetical protein